MPDGTRPTGAAHFRPLASEFDLPDLPVSGEIPRGLRGTFFRNGPNPQFPQHPGSGLGWLLGDGMVHAFTLADGRCGWRNRWVRTHKWCAENAAGRALMPGYPKPSLAGLGIRNSGVANTAVLWHAGRLLALEEGHAPFALDPRSLETLRVERFGAGLRGPFTAHPKIDPATGEMIFFGYAVDGPMTPAMRWGVIGPDGRVARVEPFRAPYCAMVHDIAVTARHVLFPVMPLIGSLWRAVLRGRPFLWDPDRGGHVGLLRRDAGVASLLWFRAASCFAFHVMNAWEDDAGCLHADVLQYDAPPFFPRADGRPGRGDARLARWTLDPGKGTDAFAQAWLDDTPAEFPRIDDRRAGLPNRHGALVLDRGGLGLFDTLAWRDAARGTTAEHALPPGDALSEAVFVPRCETAAEGDGWLLAIAWRAATRRSALLVFDTADVAQGPVATAHLPLGLPFGFHGAWMPG